MKRHSEEIEFEPLVRNEAYYASQLRDCLARTRRNEELFNLETDPELIEAHIYRRLALQCEYRYLLRQVRSFQQADTRQTAPA